MRLPSEPLPDRFNLGPWQVNVSLDEVAGQGPYAGQLHKLEPRAMRLLAVLAQARGEVVLADELLNAVWPGLIVTPSSLYDAVAQLRKVLRRRLLPWPTRPLQRPRNPAWARARWPCCPLLHAGCRIRCRS